MASGVLVWLFFFSAKEVCFGHASRQPPLCPLSPAVRAHLSVQIAKPSLGRSCRFCKSQARPPCRRSDALCPPELSVAKSRPPDLITLTQTVCSLLGPS